jgi:hypothetical protein
MVKISKPSNIPFFHLLSDAEFEKTKNRTWGELMCLYRQPIWCKYPEALSGAGGCWSLVGRKIKKEKDCGKCKYYSSTNAEEKNLELLSELYHESIRKTINDVRDLLEPMEEPFKSGGLSALDEVEERLGVAANSETQEKSKNIAASIVDKLT